MLGKISQVTSTLPPGTTTTTAPMAEIIMDYVENFREDLPAHVEPPIYPVVHLAYWHCRTLAILLSPNASPSELMWSTKELAELLSSNADIKAPLLNHFAQLVVLALATLSRTDKTRDGASHLAKDILVRPGGVWDAIRDKLGSQVRLSSGDGTNQSLQQLANLATAGGAEIEGADMPHIEPLLSLGYLDIM